MYLTKERGGRTLATIYRLDGVVVELPSFSRKHRVPHDLAHAVTERSLGLSRGVFGSLAAGAMFSNTQVVQGRPRYDAAERSERILKANGRELGFAELLAGAIHQVVEHGLVNVAAKVRHDWGVLSVDPCPYDEAQLRDAADELDLLGRAWEQLFVGQGLEFPWPERLSAQMMPR